MNSLSYFACAHGFCFTCWPVLISTHEFSHFYPFESLSDPTLGGVSERLCGVELPAGVKPQHTHNQTTTKWGDIWKTSQGSVSYCSFRLLPQQNSAILDANLTAWETRVVRGLNRNSQRNLLSVLCIWIDQVEMKEVKGLQESAETVPSVE